MAGDGGTEAHTLERRLAEAPYAFDFFQAVRRLQCAHPDTPPVGHSRRPADDPVRFGQKPSLAFSPSALAEFRPGSPAHMIINAFGLLGPHGAMPLHITEYALSRQQVHDFTLPAFLDVFHHRMISLFYRAWASCQQTVNFERGDEDRFAVYIASLFGQGMPAFRGRNAIPDVAKLHFSGRLACQTKCPEGLQAIVETFFGITTEIVEFVGQWVELPDEYTCRLGESPETGSMGRTAVVGSRVWECQQKFRIRMGPMDFDDYQRMLPGGESLPRLVDWVRNYLGDELLWDVQLILKKEAVPATSMGQLGQLGWSTWTLSAPPPEDADDLVLRPVAADAP